MTRMFNKNDIVKTREGDDLHLVLEDSGTRSTKVRNMNTGETRDWFTVHLYKDRDTIRAGITRKKAAIEAAKKIGLNKPRQRG